jgi:hypothetical protein
MAENGDTMQAWLSTLQGARQAALDDPDHDMDDGDRPSVQIPASAHVAATNTIGSFDIRDAANDGVQFLLSFLLEKMARHFRVFVCVCVCVCVQGVCVCVCVCVTRLLSIRQRTLIPSSHIA